MKKKLINFLNFGKIEKKKNYIIKYKNKLKNTNIYNESLTKDALRLGYVFFLKNKKRIKIPEIVRKNATRYEEQKRRISIYGAPVTTGIVLKKILFLYDFSIVRYITARCLFDETPWDLNKLNLNSILYVRFNMIILRMYTQIFVLRQSYQRVRVGLSFNNFLLFVTDYKENEFNMSKVVEGIKELFITQIGWVSGLLSNLKFVSLFFDFMKEHPEQINEDRQFIKKIRTVTELYKVPLVIIILTKNSELSFKETVIIKSDAVLITNSSFDYNFPVIYPVVGNINSIVSIFYYIELYKIASKVGLQDNKKFFINIFYRVNLKTKKYKLNNYLKYGWMRFLREKARWKKLNPFITKSYINKYNKIYQIKPQSIKI